MERNKRKCRACNWRGLDVDVRLQADPLDINNNWEVCPTCGTADNIVSICDEPGCDKEAGCGSVHKDMEGHPYRWTCYPHSYLNVRGGRP